MRPWRSCPTHVPSRPLVAVSSLQRPDGIAQARPYAARLHLIPLFREDAISILIDIDLWHNLLDDLLVFQCYAEKYLYQGLHKCRIAALVQWIASRPVKRKATLVGMLGPKQHNWLMPLDSRSIRECSIAGHQINPSRLLLPARQHPNYRRNNILDLKENLIARRRQLCHEMGSMRESKANPSEKHTFFGWLRRLIPDSADATRLDTRYNDHRPRCCIDTTMPQCKHTPVH